MAFVTFDQLSRAAPVISEKRASLSKGLSAKTVFLSHTQFDDSKYVYGAMEILEQHGAKVYVDVADASISAMAMNDRCAHVHRVIETCPRLVLLFTEKTNTSRWIPWELGLADGCHSVTRVATFPVSISSKEEPWGKQEYLGMYPQIVYATLNGNPQYAVRDPRDGKCWTLAEWLKQ
jgi:hypothetical protein